MARKANSSCIIDEYYDVDGDAQAPAEKQLFALLRRTDIQAVIIGLPITKQQHFIKLSWEHGKHVLSEKPIAASSRDAIDLLELHEVKYPHLIWPSQSIFVISPPLPMRPSRYVSLASSHSSHSTGLSKPSSQILTIRLPGGQFQTIKADSFLMQAYTLPPS